MTTTTVNLEIVQGATQNIEFDWVDPSTNLPEDLTGFTAKMQVREHFNQDPVLLEFTSADGDILLGGANGTVTLLIGPEVTKDIIEWYNAVYDIYITRASDGVVTRLVEGKFIILQRITK